MIQKFIGRDAELNEFRDILSNFSPGKPYIIYVHDIAQKKEDKGGIGKTWLLNKFIEIAITEFSDKFIVLDKLIDFYETQNHNRIDVQTNVMFQLEKFTNTKYFEPFREALSQFYAAQREHSDEVRIRLAYETMFVTYIESYRKISTTEDKIIIRFYDTLDALENFERVLMTHGRKFPLEELMPYSLAVMASRNMIDWQNPNWQDRENNVTIIKLGGFDVKDTQLYFKTYCHVEDVEESQIDTIHNKAKGRPILIGLAVDLINQRVKNIENLIQVSEKTFLESLVSYVNLFEKPRDIAITYMAHVYHHFDKKILNYLLKDEFSEIDTNALAAELATLSFVKARGEQIILQDEMRRLINLYVWKKQDPDRELRKKISQKMISYYAEKMKNEVEENYRQVLFVEQLFHELYADLEKGWEIFESKYNPELERYHLIFARLMLKILENLQEILSPEKKALLMVYEGWYEIHNANYDLASQLIENGKEELIKLHHDMKMDEILNSLGYIHRLKGDWKNAAKNYEAALEISRKFNHHENSAMILNNLGNIYRLQANTNRALVFIEESLNIRQKLGDQKQIARTLLYSGRALWEARNITEAIRQYNKAETIYQELKDEIGLARTNAHQGYVDYRLEKREQALERLDQALNTFYSKGILTEYAENLLIKGRILRDMGKMKEAETIITEARTLLNKQLNQYAICDCFLNLTILYYKKDDLKIAEENYKQGRELAEKYEYNLLWSILERYAGNIYYNGKEYDKAFYHYGNAARLATKCREVELNTVLTKIRLRLNKLESFRLVVQYCDFLIEYWQNQNLEQQYPQVIETCRGIKELKHEN